MSYSAEEKTCCVRGNLFACQESIIMLLVHTKLWEEQMKKLSLLSLALIIFVCSAFFVGCKNNEEEHFKDKKYTIQAQQVKDLLFLGLMVAAIQSKKARILNLL